MTMVASAPAPVKFDSVAIRRADRPFGLGILRKSAGPSAADLAFEAGRSVGLEAECPVPASSHYSATERDAWDAGMAEAGRIVQTWYEEHLRDLEMQAMADDVMSSGIPTW